MSVSSGCTGDSILYVDSNSLGVISETGSLILDTCSRESKLKIGIWKTYYQNGQIKSKGAYEIERYIFCGFVPYTSYRSYKIGEWSYWYANGKLKAKGEYKLTNVKIKNNCRGGAKLKVPKIKRRMWTFWDSTGVEVRINEDLEKELL